MRRSGTLVLTGLLILAASPACKKPPKSSCASNTDCAAGSTCVAGTCQSNPPLPSACGALTSDTLPEIPGPFPSGVFGTVDAGPPPDAGVLTGECTPGDFTAIEQSCICEASVDCQAGNDYAWGCTPANHCVLVCSKDSDCPTGDICDHYYCVSAPCAVDSDCSSGESCVAGACGTPTSSDSVASCAVVPPNAILATGATKTASLLARSADGTALPWTGTVSWTSANPSIVGVTGTNATVQLSGGGSAGSTTVDASIGGVSCTSATVLNFAAPAANELRVVVAAQDTRQPITNAIVTLQDGRVAVTDASGSVSFDNAAPMNSVSVFRNGFAYVTVASTTARMPAIFLPRNPVISSFAGSAAPADFANRPNPEGTMHVGLSLAALTGHWMDFRLSAIVGTPETDPVGLGGGSMVNQTMLAGWVEGLGPQMYKSNYTILTPAASTVTLWGIGGNAILGNILQSYIPLLEGNASPDPKDYLASAEALEGELGSAVLRGVPVKSGPVATNIATHFDTPLSLSASVQVGNVPSYLGGTGEMIELPNVRVFAGALNPSDGFVPLGAGESVDETDASGTGAPDGIVDGLTSGAPQGVISFRMAPAHGGLEGSSYAVVAVASSLDDLPPPGPTAVLPPTIISAAIKSPASLTPDSTGSTSLTLGDFPPVPDVPIINRKSRTLTLDAAVSGVMFHRLDLGDATQPKWLVYFPAGTTSVSIPLPPGGCDDRFTEPGTDGTSPAAAFLHSVRTPGQTFDTIINLDGTDLDDLSTAIDGFSTREISASD